MSVNRNVLLLAGVLLVSGCGPETQSTLVPEILKTAENGSLKASSDLPWTYGCDGNAAVLVEDTPAYSRVKFWVGEGQGNAVHLALFQDAEQNMVDSDIKPYGGDIQTFTMQVDKVAGCGHTYQLDAGCGRDIPEHGGYTSSNFIMSWAVGTEPCNKIDPTPFPTITPAPSPTPRCEECSQPTSTPRPTPSPVPTPSCNLPASVGLICHSPYGSPESECSAFGLITLGKDDNLNGSTHVASMSSDFALVKDGRGDCAQGQVAYRAYQHVTLGQILSKPQNAGDISHVTYCNCGS